MDFAYKKLGERYSPIIPLKLHLGNIHVDTDALIDSGSNLSVFRLDVALKLGLSYKSGKPFRMLSVQGSFLVYLHVIQLSIGDSTFPCHIGFSESFTPNLNLLGRIDFFDRFLITFDERNKKVVLN
ncbi:MAG TPA: hypothetical protein VJB66_03630 [Candidatus Nanoarchaeia archaeon]|nr:hypothetical protein [Candidatus Nanoarchaeia archaeon]